MVQMFIDDTTSMILPKLSAEAATNQRYIMDSRTHSAKRIKRIHPSYDCNNRDDALLLAAFADLASKTAKSTSHSSRPTTSSSYPGCISSQENCSLRQSRGRPRTVSNESTSVQDEKMITSVPKPILDPVKKPIEIQPKHTGKMSTPAFVYTTILKKKFSWKNYPTLEKFLIANREEYLRHSTLNYTVQQKHYNNHLTKQMIELAAQCGLVFDDNDFSFVTIRDRIRCYYKSYVQSLKKRGVLLGYAARKAGLVSDNDIELSASTAGKIYLPKI